MYQLILLSISSCISIKYDKNPKKNIKIYNFLNYNHILFKLNYLSLIILSAIKGISNISSENDYTN